MPTFTAVSFELDGNLACVQQWSLCSVFNCRWGRARLNHGDHRSKATARRRHLPAASPPSCPATLLPQILGRRLHHFEGRHHVLQHFLHNAGMLCVPTLLPHLVTLLLLHLRRLSASVPICLARLLRVPALLPLVALRVVRLACCSTLDTLFFSADLSDLSRILVSFAQQVGVKLGELDVSDFCVNVDLPGLSTGR